MRIARNVVAKLLETKPSNIKDLKQIEAEIHIKLGDSDEELSMTIQEYQNCLQQLRRNKEHINHTNFVTIIIIFGTFVWVTMTSMNTNPYSNEKPQGNTELTAEY